MNLYEWFDKKVILVDCDGKVWRGKVETYTSSLDSVDNLEEIALMTREGLIAFTENEIVSLDLDKTS